MTRRIVFMVVVAASLAFVGCVDDPDDEPVESTRTTPAPRITTTARVAADCATVAFTPDSEDAASSVRAIGLSCAEAEAFVRIAGTRTSSGGPQSVDVEGYRCVLTSSTVDPLPTATYSCTNGDDEITFVRS